MTDSKTLITLRHLPKVSLNNYYSGRHWGERNKDKKDFILAVRLQCRAFFKKENIYSVDYVFNFKNRPLDASNCAAMLKMIEDILFESDSYKTVVKITIESRKAKEDSVKIIVNNLGGKND